MSGNATLRTTRTNVEVSLELSNQMTDEEIQGRTRITCSDCGKSDSVPFVPTPGRAVYCRDCWRKRRDREKGQANERVLRATSIIHDSDGLRKSGYYREDPAEQ